VKLGLVGPNGSGKTTLAKHLVGLIKPTVGCVRVTGRDTRTTPIKELVAQVGYVFQNPDRQLCAETVEDEIAFGLQNRALTPGEIAERVERTLAQLGLTRFRKEAICTLGLADRQRIAIASLLVTEPALLVLDEPTCWLDGGQSRALMSLLDEVHQRGQTIVLITHNMRLVADHASRVVGLLDGHVVLDAPTRTALTCTATLDQLLLCAPQVTRLAQRLASLGFPPDVLTLEEMATYIDGRVGRRGTGAVRVAEVT
jgi:energy-coupling factor transport system ATP-binding protein